MKLEKFILKKIQHKVDEISESIKKIAGYKNCYTISIEDEDEAYAIGQEFANADFDVTMYPCYNILWGKHYKLKISWQ